MNILGIDPGKGLTGLVVWDGTDVLYQKEISFNVNKWRGYNIPDTFIDALMDIANECKPDLIVREGAHKGAMGIRGFTTYCQVCGMIDAICWDYLSIMPVTAGNKQWQKVVFGKACLGRDQAKDSAWLHASQHITPTCQDIADAWCLAQYGWLKRDELDALRRD